MNLKTSADEREKSIEERKFKRLYRHQRPSVEKIILPVSGSFNPSGALSEGDEDEDDSDDDENEAGNSKLIVGELGRLKESADENDDEAEESDEEEKVPDPNDGLLADDEAHRFPSYLVAPCVLILQNYLTAVKVSLPIFFSRLSVLSLTRVSLAPLFPVSLSCLSLVSLSCLSLVSLSPVSLLPLSPVSLSYFSLVPHISESSLHIQFNSGNCLPVNLPDCRRYYSHSLTLTTSLSLSHFFLTLYFLLF